MKHDDVFDGVITGVEEGDGVSVDVHLKGELQRASCMRDKPHKIVYLYAWLKSNYVHI